MISKKDEFYNWLEQKVNLNIAEKSYVAQMLHDISLERQPNGAKPIVSGALPALVGLSEYINNSYDFVDGDWYWKVDVEGDCPLSIEQVIANFISRQ